MQNERIGEKSAHGNASLLTKLLPQKSEQACWSLSFAIPVVQKNPGTTSVLHIAVFRAHSDGSTTTSSRKNLSVVALQDQRVFLPRQQQERLWTSFFREKKNDTGSRVLDALVCKHNCLFLSMIQLTVFQNRTSRSSGCSSRSNKADNTP